MTWSTAASTAPSATRHVLPEVREVRASHARSASRSTPGCPEARGREHAVLDPVDAGDPDGRPVQIGAVAAAGPPPPGEGGRRDDADHGLAVPLEGDQRREDRDPAHEVHRPVDRIEHPPSRGVAILSQLLAQDALAGTVGRDARAQRPFDLAIDLRHRRQVGLRLDAEVERPEARQGDRVGEIREGEGEREVGVVRGERRERLFEQLARGEHEPVLAAAADELHRRRQPQLGGATGKCERGPAEHVERVGEPDRSCRGPRAPRSRRAGATNGRVGVTSRSTPARSSSQRSRYSSRPRSSRLTSASVTRWASSSFERTSSPYSSARLREEAAVHVGRLAQEHAPAAPRQRQLDPAQAAGTGPPRPPPGPRPADRPARSRPAPRRGRPASRAPACGSRGRGRRASPDSRRRPAPSGLRGRSSARGASSRPGARARRSASARRRRSRLRES